MFQINEKKGEKKNKILNYILSFQIYEQKVCKWHKLEVSENRGYTVKVLPGF